MPRVRGKKLGCLWLVVSFFFCDVAAALLQMLFCSAPLACVAVAVVVFSFYFICCFCFFSLFLIKYVVFGCCYYQNKKVHKKRMAKFLSKGCSIKKYTFIFFNHRFFCLVSKQIFGWFCKNKFFLSNFE